MHADRLAEIEDELKESYRNRRCFCIVSHPDAGKTTLTEKLLLYGGAIHEAGTVKARKASRYATSDWMEIEKQRGISVTSSVLQFDYQGYRVNLLDTPGHHDFSEDTYRVLTAVDSALMVVDGAKGVEEQTKKLMKICSDRKIPVLTFVNKFDRECRNPLELLDEIEAVLGIQATPITLPVNSGKTFRGIYHLYKKEFYPFVANTDRDECFPVSGWDDPQWKSWLDDDELSQLKDQAELALGVYPEMSQEALWQGRLTGVYFGSALNNFGVEVLLREFCHWAPEPQARFATERLVEPSEPNFSGFVFKIQANMDQRHRDRIAFVRVCSGSFSKGDEVFHTRLERNLKISNTFQFLASKRVQAEMALAGDIVGVYDTGSFRVGDTISSKEKLSFLGIPNFAPEIFQRVVLKSPLKSKQLRKGLDQLCEEGASQVFFPQNSNDIIIGVVGQLQFEVIRHRLEHEYSVDARFESCAFKISRWVFSKEGQESKFDAALNELSKSYDVVLSKDSEDRWAVLISSQYALNKALERYPDLHFAETSERML
ncbi:MAG: peptide chain release factor 3 [Bradymonadales bacterium]|nr:MAG: peptide chain release factor 3 [Bradymonadales bacterium]